MILKRRKLEPEQKPALKQIRNRVSLSSEWWEGKSHVLIDMDGTLIGQPGALFHNLFALFALLRLSKLATFRQLLRAVKKTQEIVLSSHGFASNRDAFFETLAMELKVTRARVERFSEKFFDSDYPFICLILHSEPHARHMVDLLHATGRHITLATNAVFGRREIELRLKASDLYLHDFDLVTSWDVMKSTKPHSDFFTETLRMIGARPESTVMIGNDPYYDLPAHKLGISTLLVGGKLSMADIAHSLEEHMRLHFPS
ncbi:MAG: HAD family hydrolase [Silvanigrellales bacterium]|jgi:FMN phosphatase YigB (HAD superfamily)|nr:HAD family hydrolase [Silvanigrellales bacterium]